MQQFSIPEQSKYSTLERARSATIKLGSWYVLTATPEMALSGSVVLLKQIHGGNILRVGEAAGREGDGIYIDRTGVSAGIVTADCVPVVLAGERAAVIVHASRKSLVRGILDNVTTYIEPAEIDHIYIGPHICRGHFSFEEEKSLLRRFRLRYPEAVHFHRGKVHLSLKEALARHFREMEIHPDKVKWDRRCTFEDGSLPSYRRWVAEGEQGELQQMTTVVWRAPGSGSIA